MGGKEGLVTGDDEPRFMLAITSVEERLRESPELGELHYEANSGLAIEAQQFDFVSGATGASFEGDMTSAVRKLAEQLRKTLDEYSGPIEIKRIYEDIYGAELARILGDGED